MDAKLTGRRSFSSLAIGVGIRLVIAGTTRSASRIGWRITSFALGDSVSMAAFFQCFHFMRLESPLIWRVVVAEP